MSDKIINCIIVIVIIAAPFIAYFWQGRKGGIG